MTFLDMVILTGAAVLAGGLNAVAGGGSFISFPALVQFGGIPDINANATNTVALWPGALASVGAYRREVTAHPRVLVVLSVVSIIGGILGALLLLNTPPETFRRMVPYLLLAATLLFTFGSKMTDWLRSHVELKETSWPALIVVASLQLIIAIYGGFFGGGLGILMLATLTLLGLTNMHVMNGIKMFLNAFINGVAVVTFVYYGAVVWPQALLMMVGSVIGGYGAAHYARQIEPLLVRRFAIVVGFVMTFIFFVRG